jgi:hypothetical protein
MNGCTVTEVLLLFYRDYKYKQQPEPQELILSFHYRFFFSTDALVAFNIDMFPL